MLDIIQMCYHQSENQVVSGYSIRRREQAQSSSIREEDTSICVRSCSARQIQQQSTHILDVSTSLKRNCISTDTHRLNCTLGHLCYGQKKGKTIISRVTQRTVATTYVTGKSLVQSHCYGFYIHSGYWPAISRGATKRIC